jgi:signal transduction histidine kinase
VKSIFLRTLLAVALIAFFLLAVASFSVNPPGASCLLQAVIVAVFGVAVLRSNRRSGLNRAFFFFALAYTGYLLLVYLLHMAMTIGIEPVKTAVWLLRNGLLLIPPTTVYFTHRLLGSRSRFLLAMSWLSLLTMLPFMALNFMGLYVTEYRPLVWTYVPSNALGLYRLSALASIFWISLSAVAVLVCCFGSGERQKRPLYILFLLGWGVAVGYALMGFSPAFNKPWYPSYVGAMWGLFPMALGIGIMKFRLFDIKLVIRRTLPYAVGTGVIGGLYALCLYGLQVIGNRWGVMPGSVKWIALLVLLGLAFQPILEELQKLLDRIFFRAEAELDRFLAQAGARYIAAASAAALTRMIVADARDALKLEGGALLLGPGRVATVTAEGGLLPLREAVGQPMPAGPSAREPLEPDEAGNFALGGESGALSGALTAAGVRLVTPFGEGPDRGILACQQKMSHLPFTPRDKMFLSALAAQAETALSRLKARQDAESAHKLTDAVFESMTNAVALLARDGRVLSCNPAFQRAFGAAEGQVIPSVASDALAEAGSSGASRELETPHGTFLVSARKLEGPDGVTLAVLTDVTELRRLQEADRRKAALAELGATVSSINHEIGNIISPLGYQLGKISRAGSMEEVAGPLRVATDRVAALERLGRELREFYKEPQLSLRRVRLRDVVESALADVRSGAGGAWTAPELSGLDLEVTADVQKLKQVLLNVVKNAWEAMQESPRREWAIAALAEADKAVITVRDSGTGIPPECKKRLFQPFFTTKKERGTGLGLATVRRITEAHGAGIEIESDPAAGTTVTFRWPLAAGRLA